MKSRPSILPWRVRVRRSPPTRATRISASIKASDATLHPADAVFHDRGAFDRLSPGDQTIAQCFRKEHAMKRALALLLVVVLWAATGCANMTPTQQRALSGGAIGAAGGAAVGAIVGGSPALGAVVGGAAGTAVGALWEDIHKALK
jgi:osmotically inducible lipoprotein OsmB